MSKSTIQFSDRLEPELLDYQHSWSLERYQAMVEAGFLNDEDKVELLFGKIVDISPIGVTHSYCIQELVAFFYANYASKYIIRSEQPIALAPHSMPEPNIVLAQLRTDRSSAQHPGPDDIQLIIEVAESTLQRDRTVKARLYGTFQIPEYWILNLIDHRLEVYTKPNSEGGYFNRLDIHMTASFESPLLGPLLITDALPKFRTI